MEKKSFNPGDKVTLTTKTKDWTGNILESHDPEIILLKLQNGYNIGIRESEVLKAELKGAAEQKPNHRTTEPPNHPQKLPTVAFVITGGTISSRLDPKSGGVISTDKEAILEIAPEIKKICNPIILNPFTKFSEDMSYHDWKTLAETTLPLLQDDKISGIIITHGTDFLHYTAAALSYFIKNLNKPLALTYSQRSIDRASTDAHLNLICATKYATSDIAEIALIGHETENDDYCLAMPAKSTRKMHTSKRAAFQIINDSPIARISKNSFNHLKEFNARQPKSNNQKHEVGIDTAFQEKVASIKIQPGMNPNIIEFYQKEGYKGLVLELTGIGQAPGKNAKHNWLPKIKKAIESGMTIVATPQTINGTLNPNVYSAGRDLQKTGIIFSKETTETALIKLGWVLGHRQWNKKEKILTK